MGLSDIRANMRHKSIFAFVVHVGQCSAVGYDKRQPTVGHFDSGIPEGLAVGRHDAKVGGSIPYRQLGARHLTCKNKCACP